MARANPFRFSTKYQDYETDLVYYGYRYMKDGSWISRDPIEERGGRNLYVFLANTPINAFDFLGFCAEAVGKNGQPLYVFTLPGKQGGWKGEVIFRQKAGSAEAQAIQNIKVRWKAEVSVLCSCGCGIKSGTRLFENDEEGTWLVYDPASLPMGLPVVRSVMSGIGKLIQKGLQRAVGAAGVVAPRETIQDIINVINGFPVPTAPGDGAWEGGKSPCAHKSAQRKAL